MARTHGQIRLKPQPVLLKDDISSWKAALFLPPPPRGTVIFGGLPSARPGISSQLLDALADAGLGVLLLPRLRPRRQAAQLRRLVRAARAWLNSQAWTADLAQGLLGCGP